MESETDVHGGEFCGEVSEDVREVDGLGVDAVSARAAEGGAAVGAGDGGVDAAALGADVVEAAVGAVEEAVLDEHGGAVGDEGVALHLAEADAAAALAALEGLLGDLVDGPDAADLELVLDLVDEALVVDDADVDLGLELAAGDARVEALGAVVAVARAEELLAKVVAGGVLLVVLEGGAVLPEALEGAALAGHGLDEHADGHARREGAGVDDAVGRDAALAEGHVLLREEAARDALLAVAARELVADDGVARVAQLDRGLARPVARALHVAQVRARERLQHAHAVDVRLLARHVQALLVHFAAHLVQNCIDGGPLDNFRSRLG